MIPQTTQELIDVAFPPETFRPQARQEECVVQISALWLTTREQLVSVNLTVAAGHGIEGGRWVALVYSGEHVSGYELPPSLFTETSEGSMCDMVSRGMIRDHAACQWLIQQGIVQPLSSD